MPDFKEMKKEPVSESSLPRKDTAQDLVTAISVGQFIVGFVLWLVIGTLINFSVVDLPIQENTLVFLVLLPIQIFGYWLATLTFRYKVRWIGYGIITAIVLFVLGFFIHSGGITPSLPFPISLISA